MEKLSDLVVAGSVAFFACCFGVLTLTVVKHLNAEEYAEAPACVVTGDNRGQKK
jgi:hypothetical protein